MTTPVALRFLGSGDAFGSGGRFQTCMHLSGAGGAVLIDCGASSLIAMKRDGVDPGDVDVVLLTHLHGDHFGGVPFLILDAQFTRRARPLLIAAPPGVRTRVEATMEALFPGSTAVQRKFEVEFIELAERRTARVGPTTVTAFPVVHASGAPPCALRVDYGGRIIAYSGDTEWAESLIEAAHGADLFVCEAYTFDRPVKFHLDYKTIEAQAERLGARRIILTHMGRDMLAREAEARFERAHDGLVVTL
jgi:ribonuclease BN (tRNA processing enzyme)